MMSASKTPNHIGFVIPAIFAGFLLVIPSQLSAAAQAVSAITPYTVSVFATSVTGSYTKPDSIAADRTHVFVGYGNGNAADGSDGKSSTIVEYSMNGAVLKTFTVKGHNDGLKVDPKTNLLWSIQNEDGSPNIVIIDPKSGTQSAPYTFASAAHGGGYDDVAFVGQSIYISASNPQSNPNSAPALVRATLSGTTVTVTPVLLGNGNATDVRTGKPLTLNLQDPDSLIVDPDGDLVLDSQADAELIIVHAPGSTDQGVFHLAITSGGAPTQIDDTVFATSSEGAILVSDRDDETVYSIQAPFFPPSGAYSAASTFVGRLDMNTGKLTPVVTGMASPHGMAFIPE